MTIKIVQTLHILFILILLTAGCATIPPCIEKMPSNAFDAGETTSLGRLLSSQAGRHPGKSGFHFLDTGEEAFIQRSMLADAARHSIDAQYYIWNSDTTGKLMAERMLRAAGRGVRVRLLLDDFNVDERDLQILAMNAHPNIEVRIYNPFSENARSGYKKMFAFIFNFNRLNRRMHNKTYTADGSFAIVGGRNIGDEYFDVSHELNFRDQELLAAGPVVGRVSENFDTYWNSEWTYPIDRVVTNNRPSSETVNILYENLLDWAGDPDLLPYEVVRDPLKIHELLAKQLKKFIWAEAVLIYDNPGEKKALDQLTPHNSVALALQALLKNARKDALIESAYFTPGSIMLDAFEQLTGQGVSVRFLTNSSASNDVLMNHAGYARTRPKILRTGIKLFELRPDAKSCLQMINNEDSCDGDTIYSLHSKSAVFDRKIVYIGSFNMNMRSAYLNSETALIVYSPVLAEQVANAIEENLKPENSWRVEKGQDGVEWVLWVNNSEKRTSLEPGTSLWKGIKSGFISLFPLEKYY